MSESERGRVTRSPAEVYDEFFVPALFQQWGSVVADAAGIGPGQRVLDVACGTGVLACATADRAGLGGAVVGLDLNEEMLAVARRKSARVEWREGRAEALPFPNDSFDAVVSQFGFGDRVADAFSAPFVLGDPERLLALCADAGIVGAKVTRHEGTVRFVSIESLISTERACVWTLGSMLDDAQFERLLKEAEQALRPFVTADGTIAFAMPALIVTVSKP